VVVVVFDADVLIAYLGRHDAHHSEAVKRVRRALEPGNRRVVSAVDYAEVLVGPLRQGGPDGARLVDVMLTRLAIETIPVDGPLARAAADVRERTRLKLPDAFALATAIHVEERPDTDVRLESFDERVLKAHAALRRASGDLR